MTSLTIADVKPFLGLTQNVNDDELTAVLASAELAITHKVGPLVETEVTEVLAGSGTCELVVLGPIRGVTSITGSSGGTVAPDRFDATSGVIYCPTYMADDYYTVVYDAGWAATAATIPADLKQAVAWQTQLDWQTMRGKAQRAPDDLQRRIREKLAPYLGHGFA